MTVEPALEALKSCPFCGGTNLEIRGNGIGDYYVICYSNDETEMSCGARTDDSSCETTEGAILRWNRRATPPLSEPVGWRDIATAPKDGTRVLAKIRVPSDRQDARHFDGIVFVAAHPGLEDDGLDIGWGFAAPVGQGGFTDDWLEGWMPLPLSAPSQNRRDSMTGPILFYASIWLSGFVIGYAMHDYWRRKAHG